MDRREMGAACLRGGTHRLIPEARAALHQVVRVPMRAMDGNENSGHGVGNAVLALVLVAKECANRVPSVRKRIDRESGVQAASESRFRLGLGVKDSHDRFLSGIGWGTPLVTVASTRFIIVDEN